MVRILLCLILMMVGGLCAASPPVGESGTGGDPPGDTPLLYSPLDIPVRDGQTLAADLYFSGATPEPRPVILIQTPYNKNYYRRMVWNPEQPPLFPLDRHYNYVALDWRGFYGSTDAAVAGYDRGLDGYDAVEWIAAQPWCDGRVGTWGSSALGYIQFQTARHRPPRLVCSVPRVKDIRTTYSDYYYGGVYRREHIENMEQLGLVSTDLILAHPTRDFFWQIWEQQTDFTAALAVPMFIIGGWFDHYPETVLAAFHDLRTQSPAPARNQHKLLFGPWLHGEVDESRQGILEYPNATGIADEMTIRFWDFHLRDQANGWEEVPPVTYYQMGDNDWVTTDTWENPRREERILYLTAGGHLAFTPPADDEPPAPFDYDPADPTPAVGGARFSPFDPDLPIGPQDLRTTIENRGDVLVYSTAPLTYDLRLAGPVRILLYVSSDRLDTDICIRLTEVFPDGRSVIMTQGIRRMRFRNGYSAEELMIPGEIYPVEVELQDLALTIRRGHRLSIVVSSAAYPHFDANPNSGGPLYEPGPLYIARNTIWHDADHPSHVLLSVPWPSDISGDGQADATDLLLLAAYLADNAGGFPLGAADGDVNGDGVVKVVDLIELAVRLVAGAEQIQ
ncbi:MAG: CocE/NonD family hydrolase [Acidobacteria bacterium]|nr:CocE/NonD family hydrolase [Acidobacteriota bacterium]